MLCTAIDVTEKRLFEVRLAAMAAQVAIAYQRFELALENSQITRLRAGPCLRYTYIHNPPLGTAAEDFIERTDADVFPRPTCASSSRRSSACSTVERAGGVELELRLAGRSVSSTYGSSPRSTATAGDSASSAASLDLTERQRNDKRCGSMMRELTHRSKNLLAVCRRWRERPRA